MGEFMDVPIIDGHVHLRGLEGIAEHMKLLGESAFSGIGIVSGAARRASSLRGNSLALLCKAMHPDRAYVFGGLDYCTPKEITAAELGRQGAELLEAGCDGMKMIEGKPPARKATGFALDSPVYDELYALLAARGAPIVSHVADPETWWDPAQAPEAARRRPYWQDDQMPSKQQLYAEVDGILAKFPRLRIIFAHFYFLSNFPDRAAAFMDRWPEISFDLAPGSEMYRNFTKAPDRWREFFTRYQDRIVFGTDNISPREPRAERYQKMVDKIWMIRMFLERDEDFEGFGSDHIQGLGLDAPILEKIYSTNFKRYAGQRPRPVNLPAAMDRCRRIAEYVASDSEDPDAVGELAEIQRQMAAAQDRT